MRPLPLPISTIFSPSRRVPAKGSSMSSQNEFVIPDCDKVLGDIVINMAEKNRQAKIENAEQIKSAGLNEIKKLENIEDLDNLETEEKEQNND